MLADQGLRQVATFERRRRWLVALAVAPTFAWLLWGDDLSEQVQLVANPLLIGVVVAVVLDRVFAHDTAPAAPREAMG